MPNTAKAVGTAWERRIADYAAERGLPWDRAPLRGVNDLLDLSGTLPDGWLVGGKGITRKGNLADRMSDAMNQCRTAMANLRRIYPGAAGDVIPVQIIQRQGFPTGRAYAVMEYDEFLSLVLQRREWRGRREAG